VLVFVHEFGPIYSRAGIGCGSSVFRSFRNLSGLAVGSRGKRWEFSVIPLGLCKDVLRHYSPGLPTPGLRASARSREASLFQRQRLSQRAAIVARWGGGRISSSPSTLRFFFMTSWPPFTPAEVGQVRGQRTSRGGFTGRRSIVPDRCRPFIVLRRAAGCTTQAEFPIDCRVVGDGQEQTLD